MFVMTAKLSKPRLIAAGVLILAVVILVVALVSGGGGGSADAPDGATNDARLAYLAGFGWSVNGTPKQTQQVRIPKSADDRVFSRYNALQKSQGFDLTAHAGKEATRYVYEILNYPDASAPVYASVLVLDKNTVTGGTTATSQGLTLRPAAPSTASASPAPRHRTPSRPRQRRPERRPRPERKNRRSPPPSLQPHPKKHLHFRFVVL